MRTRPEPAVLAWLDRQPDTDLYYCAVTKAEIALGVALLPDGKCKQGLAEAAAGIFDAFEGRCLDYDCAATSRYVAIAKRSRTIGRPVSIEDMLIAAIAQANGGLLATRNISDFDFLPELERLNPWG